MEQDGLLGRHVHAQFAAQASRRPAATAVVVDGTTTAYGALASLVLDRAGALREAGVRPGDVVACDRPRGLPLVVDLLAADAAGATLLLLNPDDPHARKATVRSEAAARWSVGPTGTVTAEPRTARGSGADTPATDGARATSGAPALVFATSGSTGTPKLVALPPDALLAGVRWARSRLGAGPDDRYLFRTSPGFVTVLRHVVWPLATGGVCVVMPHGLEKDAGEVARALVRERITITTFIPSALRVTIPHLDGGAATSVRHVLCGAEPLTEPLRAATSTAFPAAEIHNLYAPTECPMVTHHACAPEEPGESPLGPAIHGAVLRVVTEEGHLAQAGESGELLVGGESLSSGYLRAGALDTSHLVDDRWGGGGRLHRTGDFARVGHDGAVHYAGRSDDFVKVRGFRVAPGEVETALHADPAVGNAVVLAVPGTNGPRLAAAVTSSTTAGVDTDAVAARLAQRIPQYMVPSVIAALTDLPRLANGKVDRASLIEALRATPTASPEVELPHDELEATILGIWRRVLDAPGAGTHDTFQSAGGDSLAAAELAFLLEDELGVEIPSTVLRTARTVSELARAVRSLS
ncbi:non-ribosomal peptide synthetase [Cellulosimicrobium protaetiae]|uniref:Non-ribosomal peptide synthetase n=1 Tax=Cellulosimicrobium protaetiae TaxID=2587808 RepID=A0A6M5U9D1_9MICO|nr:non-ribosomal peptide synthetase [Cellulosimicrobium protaetiae]QJW34850.1 non-ribosomal peptide synthetase [Cellulosimicrobium protaetiae]